MSTAQATIPSAPVATTSVAHEEYVAHKRRFNFKAIGRHLFLIIMCLWVLLPLAWVLLLSFKSL